MEAWLILVGAGFVAFSLASCQPDHGVLDTTPPAEVSDLSTSSGDGQLTLSWTDPPDNDFSKAQISYGTAGSADTAFAGTVDPNGTVVADLQNGIEYTILLKTVDTSGNVSAGTSVEAFPLAGEGAASGASFNYLQGRVLTSGALAGSVMLELYESEAVASSFEQQEATPADWMLLYFSGPSSMADLTDGEYRVYNMDDDWPTDQNAVLFQILLAHDVNSYSFEGQYLGFNQGGIFDDPPATVEHSNDITDGTVTLSRNGDVYTISWTFTTSAEGVIVGSYEGTLDEEIQS